MIISECLNRFTCIYLSPSLSTDTNSYSVNSTGDDNVTCSSVLSRVLTNTVILISKFNPAKSTITVWIGSYYLSYSILCTQGVKTLCVRTVCWNHSLLQCHLSQSPFLPFFHLDSCIIVGTNNSTHFSQNLSLT